MLHNNCAPKTYKLRLRNEFQQSVFRISICPESVKIVSNLFSVKKRGVRTINLGFVYFSKRGKSINNMGQFPHDTTIFLDTLFPYLNCSIKQGLLYSKKLLTPSSYNNNFKGLILYFDSKGSSFIKKGLLYFKYFYPFFLQQQSYEGCKNHVIGVSFVF